MNWIKISLIGCGLSPFLQGVTAEQADSKQTLELEGAPRLEQTIVTAQKREENLLEVPISINVVNHHQIANSNNEVLQQLEGLLTSVNFGRGDRKTRGEITIRGVGGFSRNIGSDARTVVYVDDVPMSRSSAFNADLFNIERIEVIRGAQGTLYGRNSINGAIKIFTKAPQETSSGEIKIGAGNDDYQSVSINNNLPLTTHINSQLQINNIRKNGFIENITNQTDLESIKTDALRFKFSYKPSDNFELNTTIDASQDDNEATNAVALADNPSYNGFSEAPSPRQVAHDTLEFEQREALGIALNADWVRPNDHLISAILSARKHEFEELSDEDYSSSAPSVSSIFDEEFEQYTQEFRLTSPHSQKIDYVVGSFFSQQKIITTRSANLAGNIARTPGDVEAMNFSFYANGNYRFSPKYELTFGTRVEHETKKIAYAIEDSIGIFTNGEMQDEIDFTAILPKIGLNIFPTENNLIYFNLARGAKSGGWNADFVTSLDDIKYEEEYANNFELGYKTVAWDKRLFLNAAVFYSRYSDFQVFQFVENEGVTTIQLTNAGRLTSSGIELNSAFELTPRLKFQLSTTYLDAVFNQFKNGGGIGIDYDDNTPPFAPQKSIHASLDYDIQVLNMQEPLSVYLDYSYTSSYFSHPNNNIATNKINGYHSINANARYSLNDTWQFLLWARNLTDELNLRSRDVSFLGVQRGYYEAPRSYGLSVKFSY